MTEFTPEPVMILEAPEQIKAFTDSLRIRVLRVLRERAATNQQIADELGEPHAKVLYHIRFLLDAGLIKLIDTQVKGGNVEKYYRSVAYIFDLRPSSSDPETDAALINSLVDTARYDMISSATVYPEIPVRIHTAKGTMTPARLAEFNERLLALVREYWEPDATPKHPDNARMQLVVFMYRDARDNTDS
jgi:DNA-binding transcriptional ArsR family regulator